MRKALRYSIRKTHFILFIHIKFSQLLGTAKAHFHLLKIPILARLYPVVHFSSANNSERLNSFTNTFILLKRGDMKFISQLLGRLSNSSNVSIARTADWINSQSIVGPSSEPPSGSCCNLQGDHLLNSTYGSTNMPAVPGANGRMLEEGMCFAISCQVCETPTPAEQILARNQNLCGLRIMLGHAAGNGEEGAWSSAGSDDTGNGRRGFLKRKAKRIIRFCGHLYGSLAHRWSISAKSVSNS